MTGHIDVGAIERLRAATLERDPAVRLSDLTLEEATALATHQHYKGGLYQCFGNPRDADTGETVSGVIAYRHLYPFATDMWLRSEAEFRQEERFRPVGRGDAWEDDLVAVAKAYEEWEADVIVNGDWEAPPPAVVCLNGHQINKLIEIQEMRTAALAKHRSTAH